MESLVWSKTPDEMRVALARSVGSAEVALAFAKALADAMPAPKLTIEEACDPSKMMEYWYARGGCDLARHLVHILSNNDAPN
jgi:hypothetical protein